MPSKPKNGFGAQNQYGFVIYPLIRNLNGAGKIIFLGVKNENKPSQPKNVNFGSKISMVV
jgi:hypothetical protein